MEKRVDKRFFFLYVVFLICNRCNIKKMYNNIGMILFKLILKDF